MAGKIILNTPLMINGKEYKELTYDENLITVQQFCEADAQKFASAGNKLTLATHEFDTGLHLYLGMYAIIAVNSEIDIKDLERIKGLDVIKLVNIGRNFIIAGAGAVSDQSNADDLSEITVEPSAQVQKK